MQLETQTNQIVSLLEAQIRKREAAQELREIAAQLQFIPSELKPSPEEIAAEIKAYWEAAARA